MVLRPLETLELLYEADETAWLEAMAELIRHRKFDGLDYTHLEEYLSDMARRDRQEVESRLTVLLAHLLKWEHQPERRSASWRATILTQRLELRRHCRRGVLRNHAEGVLGEVYLDAARVAALEMEVPVSRLPSACPYTLEQLLADDMPEN